MTHISLVAVGVWGAGDTEVEVGAALVCVTYNQDNYIFISQKGKYNFSCFAMLWNIMWTLYHSSHFLSLSPFPLLCYFSSLNNFTSGNESTSDNAHQ